MAGPWVERGVKGDRAGWWLSVADEEQMPERVGYGQRAVKVAVNDDWGWVRA